MRSINAKQYVKSKKNGINDPIYKKEIESQIYKKKLMVTTGEKGEGINWEIGIDIYTLLSIK